ncbi:MAG: hypothetical protein LKE51_07980 [Selenomonas sp.]|nr:hypothetical protein [Selenomonas sp.]
MDFHVLGKLVTGFLVVDSIAAMEIRVPGDGEQTEVQDVDGNGPFEFGVDISTFEVIVESGPVVEGTTSHFFGTVDLDFNVDFCAIHRLSKQVETGFFAEFFFGVQLAVQEGDVLDLSGTFEFEDGIDEGQGNILVLLIGENRLEYSIVSTVDR